MALNILYFASLRETLGVSQENCDVPSPPNMGALIDTLRARGEIWAVSLAPDKRWRVAVNQEMASNGTLLNDGDEVAIFPPVTGG